MLFLVRPILFKFLQSKAVKKLIVDLLTAMAESTKSEVDDHVVAYVKAALYPTMRIEK
jgi:hypothetical protein